MSVHPSKLIAYILRLNLLNLQNLVQVLQRYENETECLENGPKRLEMDRNVWKMNQNV